MNKCVELTDRQKWLYDYLEKVTAMGTYATQYDIAYNWNCEGKGDYYVMSDNPNSHDKCTAIWSDVNAINTSLLKDKPIIAKNFTYRLATNAEETMAFAKKYYIAGLKKLKRYYSIVKMVRRDGQGDVFDEDKFYEAFVKAIEKEEDEDNDLCEEM